MPVASPPRLVVSGFYRYVRNPIYVGFMAIHVRRGAAVRLAQASWSTPLLAWCIGAAAVRFYEEPILARRFGAEYQDYRRAVRAWVPRLHPWTPGEPDRTGRHMRRPVAADRSPARGGVTWPASKESRPPRPGCT